MIPGFVLNLGEGSLDRNFDCESWPAKIVSKFLAIRDIRRKNRELVKEPENFSFSLIFLDNHKRLLSLDFVYFQYLFYNIYS